MVLVEAELYSHLWTPLGHEGRVPPCTTEDRVKRSITAHCTHHSTPTLNRKRYQNCYASQNTTLLRRIDRHNNKMVIQSNLATLLRRSYRLQLELDYPPAADLFQPHIRIHRMPRGRHDAWKRHSTEGKLHAASRPFVAC